MDEHTSTIEVAKRLLGSRLVHHTSQGIISGIIVETEAYTQNDPACHAFRRRTARCEPMFGDFFTAYIYRIYGIHLCLNVVTRGRDVGEAVLIRAIEPTQGVELMQQFRRRKDHLCDGPGKLVEAFNISLVQNGSGLYSPPLFIELGELSHQITTTTRIGISVGKDLPYRFYLTGNPWISRK